MTITPEIAAKLIYGISQLRYFEREYAKDNHVEMRRIVDIWRNRIDQLLEDIGATEFVPLKELLNQIQLINTLEICKD